MSRQVVIGALLLSAVSIGGAAHVHADVGVAEQSQWRLALQQSARAMVVESYAAKRTLQVRSLGELIKKAAPVNRNAWARYGGDFAKYWAASNVTNQRVGKGFEAILAWRINNELATSPGSSKVLVTAVEGYHTSPTDLVEVLPDGHVTTRFQAKFNMNLKSASKHLGNPKYKDHVLVTTKESLKKLERDLMKAEAKASRRGLPLSPELQEVRDALDDGRIARSWGGKPLPTQAEVTSETMRATKEAFEETANTGGRSRTMRILAYVGPKLEKVLIVVEVVTTGYMQYRDTMRYARGEIGHAYFATKSTTRALTLGLIAYGAFSPEPVSKVSALIAAGAIIAVDIAADAFQERADHLREESLRNVLRRIDRHERYLAVRAKLAS